MTIDELNQLYRDYQDRATPWPDNWPDRVALIKERNKLDYIDLELATKPSQIRRIKARIRNDEQIIAERG